jgi:hypothetical protein
MSRPAACDKIELEKKLVELVHKLVCRQGPRAIDLLIMTRLSVVPADVGRQTRVTTRKWVDQIEGIFDERVKAVVGTSAAANVASCPAGAGGATTSNGNIGWRRSSRDRSPSGSRGSQYHRLLRGAYGSDPRLLCIALGLEDFGDMPDLELTFVGIDPLLSRVNDESTLQLGTKGTPSSSSSSGGGRQGGQPAAMTTRFRHMVGVFYAGIGSISRDEFVGLCIFMSHHNNAGSGSEGAFVHESKPKEAEPVLKEDEDESEKGSSSEHRGGPPTGSDATWVSTRAGADGSSGAGLLSDHRMLGKFFSSAVWSGADGALVFGLSSNAASAVEKRVNGAKPWLRDMANTSRKG